MPTPPRKRSRALRKTSKAVRIVDRIAGFGIRLAGLGTIGAVSLVCVFLVAVAAPLFRSQRIERAGDRQWTPGSAAAVEIGIDDSAAIGWVYTADDGIRAFDVAGGQALSEHAPFEGMRPTARAIDAANGRAVFGFADGTVRLAKLAFPTSFLSDDAGSASGAPSLRLGERRIRDGAVAQRISADQTRIVGFTLSVDEPLALGDAAAPPQAIVALDYVAGPAGPTIAALSEDCRLWLKRVFNRKNFLTGEETAVLTGGSIAVERCAHDGMPQHVLLTGTGDNAYLLWRSGVLVRVDARDLAAPQIAEQLDVVVDPELAVTSAELLSGRKTLIVGDSGGTARAWFRIKPVDATTADGALLVAAHQFDGPAAPVTSLAASSRSRVVAAGYGDGSLRVVQVTSHKVIGSYEGNAGDEPIAAVALAPKDDAVFTSSPSGMARWTISRGHPEASVAALFRPVWYEGYPAPAHVWQSSSGSDEFEPKLGLVPLVFGTLKATVYSMLFGAPLALLAAIYTSEFLHPRVRARVKPTIELMASLPSVVLGFLAAIVFAPLIEDVVPQLLTAAIALPLVLLLAAHVTETLPQAVAMRLKAWRLPAAALCLPAAVAVGFVFGPSVERAVFAGDFKLWLTGRIGGGAGVWTLLAWPAAALAVTFASARLGSSGISPRGLTRIGPAAFLVGRFLVRAFAALALAFAVGHLLAAAGADPRGWLVGTYVQRNAMVVGFVMGFAIIPIIYTISEDALSSVPEHLRAGSLALGATRWQTALRIVVPTAMSGLFSAVMVGLGRAVGETMIVLMAAGNTPVLEWNVFSGLRTLSANIAVELPEAVRNSTHYRTLFLAALTLFAMTFTLNTVAEIVRMRFRKRAFQL